LCTTPLSSQRVVGSRRHAVRRRVHASTRLYFLSGLIREDDGSDTRIPGAAVEILDGYNSGRASAPSNQFGAYSSRVGFKLMYSADWMTS
jgi:hypothetical protein